MNDDITVAPPSGRGRGGPRRRSRPPTGHHGSGTPITRPDRRVRPGVAFGRRQAVVVRRSSTARRPARRRPSAHPSRRRATPVVVLHQQSAPRHEPVAQSAKSAIERGEPAGRQHRAHSGARSTRSQRRVARRVADGQLEPGPPRAALRVGRRRRGTRSVTQLGRPMPHRGQHQMRLLPVESAAGEHLSGLDQQHPLVGSNPGSAGRADRRTASRTGPSAGSCAGRPSAAGHSPVVRRSSAGGRAAAARRSLRREHGGLAVDRRAAVASSTVRRARPGRRVRARRTKLSAIRTPDRSITSHSSSSSNSTGLRPNRGSVSSARSRRRRTRRRYRSRISACAGCRPPTSRASRRRNVALVLRVEDVLAPPAHPLELLDAALAGSPAPSARPGVR